MNIGESDNPHPGGERPAAPWSDPVTARPAADPVTARPWYAAGTPRVYGGSTGPVPIAQRRWLLPVAAGVLAAGVIAGSVMAAFALPFGGDARSATVASRLPGQIGDTSPLPPSPTVAASPSDDPTPADPTPTPTANPVVPASGTLHTASAQCLTFAGNDNGTPAEAAACTDDPHQRWALAPLAADTYFIVNAATGKCLDVDQVSKDDGAAIHEWDCHRGPNQQWKIVWVADRFAMVSVNSAKCAAVDDDGKATQRDCADSDAQRWTVQAA
jgi:hypothetical protein